MEIKYIDIHSHLNLPPLSENKDAVLAKMREMGIATITVGTGLETSREAVKIAEENPCVCFAAVGIHPCDIPSPTLPEGKGWGWDELCDLASHPSVVAVGETGLDYFRDQSIDIKQKQLELFKKHIELAVKINKPLMLHVRASKGTDDAYYDALEIFKNVSYQGKANFHFFSGSKECMEKIIESGFTISVDGPITFSHDYDEMIKAVPLEKIMVETDAPFAAPAPYRGKPCEPWMVVEVAKKIAELKNLDLEHVRVQLLENSKTFFGIEF